MSIEHRIEKNVLFITFSGNLVTKNIALDREDVNLLIGNKSNNSVVFNLSNVERIDSNGIGFLIFIHNNLQKENKSSGLCCLNQSVASILEMLSIDQVLEIFETEDEAFKHLLETNV